MFERHRGPYTLFAYSPLRYTSKGYLRGSLTKRIIAENVEGIEVEEMACMVLTDSRDDVEQVWVWSEQEAQWVAHYTASDCTPHEGKEVGV